MSNLYCMGVQCPIKKQCLRYTQGKVAMVTDGTTDAYLRKCTNQKKFIQDSNNVKKGG